MKIARIIPYFRTSFGGPVNHLRKLLIGMKKYEIENLVLTTNLEDEKIFKKRNKKLISKKISIIKYAPIVKFYHYFLTPQLIVDLIKNKFSIIDLRCVRNFQIDLTLFVYTILRRNVPIMLTTHGTLTTPDLSKFKSIFKKMYFFFERILLKRVNLFIVVSEKEKRTLIKNKIPAKKIIVISHGKDILIDPDRIIYGNFRKKYNIDNDTVIISYVGRIFEGKGIQFLLKAVPLIKKKHQKVKFIIAGRDDGFLKRLKKMTKSLNIESDVIFTGNLLKNDKSLWELYKDTNIFVNPSLSESFGHVFIEAISFNIPIIYSNEDNLFLEDVKSGIYVPFGNYKKLAEGIINAMENKEIVNSLTTNAFECIKEIPTWKIVIKKYYKLYSYLIAKSIER